jgi:hypothetical protein
MSLAVTRRAFRWADCDHHEQVATGRRAPIDEVQSCCPSPDAMAPAKHHLLSFVGRDIVLRLNLGDDGR